MATLKEIEKLKEKAAKKQAEARELAKQARLAKARLPKSGVTHGGARDGAGAGEKEIKRVQESYMLLPDTVESLDSWASEKSAEAGKKVSPRLLVEAAVRAALGLPLDAESRAVLGIPDQN